MNGWDTERRVCILQRYHASQSVIFVQREFRRDFGDTLTCRWTFMRLVNMFAKCERIARRPYHRDPYVRVHETVAAVALSIQSNPRVPTRNLSAQLGVSRRSLCNKTKAVSQISINTLKTGSISPYLTHSLNSLVII